MVAAVHVIKLGGSLLDLPDLAARLKVFHRCCVQGAATVIVGGGEAANIVRKFDATFDLGEVASHWLAVRAMQLNAVAVAQWLPSCDIVLDPLGCDAVWQQSRIAVIDPLAWLEGEAKRGITIPHRWSFTSDSIAAHIAVQLRAAWLTLLKSTSAGHRGDLALASSDPVTTAAESGIIDAEFPATAASIPTIELINLRHASLAEGRVDDAARCLLRGGH